MCRYGEISFAPDPTVVARARSWLRGRLERWELGGLGEDLQIVVSELVTNAVIHARTTVELALSVGEGAIELSVADNDGRPPEVRRTRALWDEGGRGLALVSALSDDWGVTHRAGGKQIWVRLPAPDGWDYATACTCAHPDANVRRIASGHPVVDMLG